MYLYPSREKLYAPLRRNYRTEILTITGYTHPWGVRVVLGLGSLEAAAAASRVEAFHWGLVA